MAFQPPEPSFEPEPPPAPRLSSVESTLLIPLAARAHGDPMFPHMAVHDAWAPTALAGLQADVRCFLQDKLSVYGVLSRTRLIKSLARDFFGRHPQGWGANLGCGMSCYFQWLDTGANHWLDADVPQVMALRQTLLPPPGKRLHQATVNLSQPRWWNELGLPRGAQGQPVLLILEGVLMYLSPAEVAALLQEFATCAPPGSELVCDTLSWMAVGAAARHPSVRHTQTQFRWGPRRMADFTQAHPRLRLQSEHAVLDGYHPACAWMCASFRAFWGVPVYGLVRLGLNEGAHPGKSQTQAR